METSLGLERNVLDDEEREGVQCKQRVSKKHQHDERVVVFHLNNNIHTSNNNNNKSTSSRWFRLMLLLLLCLVAVLFFTDRMELFHNDNSGVHNKSHSIIIPQDSRQKYEYSVKDLQAQRLRLMLTYNFSNPSAINYTALVQELKLARVFNPQYPTSTIPPGSSSRDDDDTTILLPSWCTYDQEHPSNETGPLVNRTPYTTGILYNKMPKAASSTLSGIVLRIAHNVAKRYYNGNDEASSSQHHYHPCTSFQHHIEKEGFVKRLFGGRDFTKSFLFSSVRDPASQALSHVYFRHVSRRGGGDADSKKKYLTDEKIITEYLQDTNHQNGVVSNGVGGYQIAYLTFDMPSPLYFAWNPRIDPTKVLRPMQVHKVVQAILGKYDFLVSVERFDESLVALQLLLGLETSDILYLSSKAAGSSYTYRRGRGRGGCFFLYKPNASDAIAAYLKSDTWYARQYGDYVLVEAVKQSLDLTIDYLGKSRFDQALAKFRAMHRKAQDECASKAIFPCSNKGEEQVEAARKSCYFADWGCGYDCLDNLSLVKQ